MRSKSRVTKRILNEECNYKRDSVLLGLFRATNNCGYSSGPFVANELERLYPEAARTTHWPRFLVPYFPIWSCFDWGLPSRGVTPSLVGFYPTVSPFPIVALATIGNGAPPKFFNNNSLLLKNEGGLFQSYLGLQQDVFFSVALSFSHLKLPLTVSLSYEVPTFLQAERTICFHTAPTQ